MSSVSFSSILAALLIACSAPPAPAEAPEPAAPKAEAPVPAPDDGIPDTAAGHRLRWVLALLDGRQAIPDAAGYAQVFAPAFVSKVPHAQFSRIVESMRPAGPFELVEIKPKSTDSRLAAVVAVKTSKMVILLGVTGDDHRIETLLIRPETTVTPVASWKELSDRLDATGQRAQYLAARIDDRARCVEISADDAGEQMAIGSAFKLYVLLALHRQIAAGKLAWDRELAISDKYKSLPSGTMQTLAAGTKKPIKEFALKMISISDNTATDHLLHLVGRDRVEKALRSTKHSAAARNVPFLSTRELFALKLGIDDKARAAYLAMSPRRRRRYLDRELASIDLNATVSPSAASSWTTPRAIDSLEWFASSRDLCKVMAALRAAGDKAPEIREVMSANPGVGIDKKIWTYAGYKGGSEPGVMSLTWLLQHASGSWHVFSLTVNDTEKALDQAAIAALAQAGLAFFGQQVASGG